MLSACTLLSRDGLGVSDVACRHGRGRGRSEEVAGFHAVVFVRRGCFVRSVDGSQGLLDPTLAYCQNPGEEQRYDHPHDHGDDCTAVSLEPTLVAELWGGDPSLPAGPLPVPSTTELEHRLLLAEARRGGDPHELFERALEIGASTLERHDPRRVGSGRPSTERARRALVDGAREALAADPGRSLPELARSLAVSPHHLSRVFRSATGHTIARHRMRLRAAAALERLTGGERNLSRLAAELGFADQSHLSRVLRGTTGATPAALRAALA